MSPLRALRWWCEALALRTSLSVFRWLSLRQALDLGQALGQLAYVVLGRRRRTAKANVARVFAKVWSSEQQARLTRASFESLGRLVAEFARLPLLNRENVRARVRWSGFEEYQAIRARGRGVLYLAAHFGPWELLPYAQAVVGAPMAFVVRPADNPLVEALVTGIRERNGNQVIPKAMAVRECLRRLKLGETVGILIDQHVPEARGVETQLLGQSVFTTPILAALARRTGAALLPAFTLPEADGSIHIVLGPEIVPAHGATVAETTQLLVDVVERYVRERPELWLWSHRRFRDANSGPH